MTKKTTQETAISLASEDENELTWNEAEKGYLDSKGVRVSIEPAKEAIKAQIQADVQVLTSRLKAKEISLIEWRDEMRRSASRYRITITALASGGWDLIDREEVSNTLATDFTRLEDIAQEVDEKESTDVLNDADALFGLLFALSETPSQPAEKSRRELLSPIAKDIIAHMSNGFSDVEFNRALMRKDDWGTNQNDGSKYIDTAAGTIKWQTPEIQDWFEKQQEKALDALDSQFAAIKSELTGDAIDILFHHWNTFPYPKKRDKAHITLAQICQYRGVKPTGDNLKNVWHAVRDIRGFSMSGGGISERLVEMSTAQLPLFGDDATPEASTILIYSPGFFLAEAIEGNKQYLAPYLQKVWELDPYRQSMAKRLARHLRSEWRRNTQFYINPDGSPASKRKRFSSWHKVLDAAGVDVQKYLDGGNPSRLIDEVDKALQTLRAIEFIEDDGPGIYEDCAAFKALPLRKGRVAAWLALRVHITPSKAIRDSLVETNGKRIARAQKKAAQKPAQKPKKKASQV